MYCSFQMTSWTWWSTLSASCPPRSRHGGGGGQGCTLSPPSAGSCAPTKLGCSKFQCFPWLQHQKSVLTRLQPNLPPTAVLCALRYILRRKEICWPRSFSRPSAGPLCPATRRLPRTSGFIRTLCGQPLPQSRCSRRAQPHHTVLPPARRTCLPLSTRRPMSMSTHAFVATRRPLWLSRRG